MSCERGDPPRLPQQTARSRSAVPATSTTSRRSTLLTRHLGTVSIRRTPRAAHAATLTGRAARLAHQFERFELVSRRSRRFFRTPCFATSRRRLRASHGSWWSFPIVDKTPPSFRQECVSPTIEMRSARRLPERSPSRERGRRRSHLRSGGPSAHVTASRDCRSMEQYEQCRCSRPVHGRQYGNRAAPVALARGPHVPNRGAADPAASRSGAVPHCTALRGRISAAPRLNGMNPGGFGQDVMWTDPRRSRAGQLARPVRVGVWPAPSRR